MCGKREIVAVSSCPPFPTDNLKDLRANHFPSMETPKSILLHSEYLFSVIVTNG